MKNLKVFCVNIKKLERFSDEYFDIIGLNQLSKRIEIRHTPELKFLYDESISYGEKIDKIIEDIKDEKEV